MIPAQLIKILNSLKKENWIVALSNFANIYVVGGSVRDAYIGNNIKDIDLIVDRLNLNQIKDILESFGKVNIVGESFSVLKFKPIGWDGEDFDIAVPRKDRKIGSTHKDFEIITDNVSILDDLKRRDFTINSVAIDIISNKILDPFDGLKDIKKRILRATDKNAFAEDPLRIMRAVMFSSRFNFIIDEETKNLMSKFSVELKTISPERILDEFMKIHTKDGNLTNMVKVMYDTGIDVALFGKKMKKEAINYKLDVLSFFYTLCKLGGVNPVEFYERNLRGEYLVKDGLRQLEYLMNLDLVNIREKDLRYEVFMRIKKSPLLLDVRIFPVRIKYVIHLMKSKIIPEKYSDVMINGHDIISIKNDIEGELVGYVLKQVYSSALMNEFDWKNSSECKKIAEDIIK